MENYKIASQKVVVVAYGRLSLTVYKAVTHGRSTVLLPLKQTLHVRFSHFLILQLWMVTILLFWGRGQEHREAHSLPHLGVNILVTLSLFWIESQFFLPIRYRA